MLTQLVKKLIIFFKVVVIFLMKFWKYGADFLLIHY